VDPSAVEVLAQHGIEPAGLAPKPVTGQVLRAADWVITLGDPDLGTIPPNAVCRRWPVEGTLDGGRGPSLVADLEARTEALWAEITTGAAAPAQVP
jgi:hypothetical protein